MKQCNVSTNKIIFHKIGASEKWYKSIFLSKCSDFKYRKWAQNIQSFFQSALKNKSEYMIPLHNYGQYCQESAPLKSRGTEGCQGQNNIKASKRTNPLHNSWPILPGECILPGMENTGDCQGEIFNSGKKTLYSKSFADK